VDKTYRGNFPPYAIYYDYIALLSEAKFKLKAKAKHTWMANLNAECVCLPDPFDG
jgi:hypothetical protein